VSEKWSRLGEKLWREARPIVGTPAEAYLKARGISLVPGPEVLRFHAAADHPKLKQRFPALIAKVIGSSEASFQVTYLAPDGKGKAAVDKADQRRTLGANKFGVVGLAEVEAGACLLVGEGVESVLSAMEASRLPGVAVLGVSSLANLEFSPDVVEVILLGENDENGASRKALDKICPTLVEKGLNVRVAMPPSGCSDLNDVLQGEGIERGSGLMIVKMAIDAAREWRPKRGTPTKPKEKPERNSQASFLVELAAARCGLFIDSQGEAYAAIPVAHSEAEAHRETHRIRSRGFSRWLRLRFYAERGARRPAKGCRARSRPSRQKRITTAPGTRSFCAQRTWAIASTSICATIIGGRSRSIPTAGG
jgi:hypothetical protein